STVGRINIIKELSIFIMEHGRDEERAVINHIADTVMETIRNLVLREGLNDETATVILKTLSSVRELGREPELKALQNVVYLYYTNQLKPNCSKKLLEEVYLYLNFQ
ncbi:MAG: hypothetical protein KBS81_03130, partial [Spirochaetales bacterium]|nr:hypothetical protein [Candidatus Physcosoma equi]